uniref:SPIN-DOC-like zinc-finger domain-containing protein n=1 Tax=Labrus bergylta TaxID=56723 RepID=A0A3Q3FDJ6_9LABR
MIAILLVTSVYSNVNILLLGRPPSGRCSGRSDVFQPRWETDYLFTEFKGKPLCLVCLETKSAMKDFNLSRHYNTTHKDKYDKYNGAARVAIVADLRGKIHHQQSFFTKATTIQESSLKASYAVSLELAKAKKPLSDGKIVKRLTRRIFDIQNHVEVKLKEVMHDCKYFSLALDESMDVTDVSQLLIYARAIDSSFEVHEELLKLVALHDTTKGRDIFNAVQSVVSEYGGFDKLSAVVTDGAPSMQGKHTGFAGLLQQSGVDCPILHCIIHQALCAKSMNFSHVMDLVTKVTNLIRGGNRSLNHKTFVAILDEVSAVYGDLQMHTEVRWMSRGKRLERFFALLAEIPVFLEDSIRCDTSAYCSKLRDTEFLFDMAFLADITSHLNHLNMQLQGRSQTPSDLYAHVNAFQSKLTLFKEDFSSDRPNLAHLRSVEQMCKDAPNARKTSQVQIEKLQPFFQAKRQERGISFWRLLPESRFPLLRDFALSTAGIFGSTYICEKRNRLTDETLFHLMQI